MRFLEDGPDIPDELLLARDQGRVVFFCGAGVSRAKAGLPDFFGLAREVLSTFGVEEGDPAAKILEVAKEIEDRTAVPGLISADRVFGLLERDFPARNIEAAVAKALKPETKPDLGAHRLLIDLATTEQGATRIVTTNFDRLFDGCDRDLESWQPPRLPDLSPNADMNGIVYLHGKANREYNGAEGDFFVLSSSEFGRAYLADGWATKFIREILEKYTVVFVGYTAEDPPVQYLLEALKGRGGNLEPVYAFQSGNSDTAAARWEHKGVEAISYDPADRHKSLWNMIEAWAFRARNPNDWQDSVVEMARQGPEALRPYQRGQVAHLVSTLEGARKFSDGDNPPPATWLCVFDKFRRYARPAPSGTLMDIGPVVDPFQHYSLDSDPVPPPMDTDFPYSARSVPDAVWDAFEPNRLDKQNSGNQNLPAFRGHFALAPPNLPARIAQLGVWLSRVSHQKAAVWWAAHQTDGLHPQVQELIRWRIERTENHCRIEVFEAWQYLFEHWLTRNRFDPREGYVFKAKIKKSGWNNARLRRYAAINHPYLKVGKRYLSVPTPPLENEPFSLSEWLGIEVEYRNDLWDIEIPDEWLARVVEVRRRNLEIAVELEIELGRYDYADIGPIDPENVSDVDNEINNYFGIDGLPHAAFSYVRLFKRLAGFDLHAAQKEMSKWNEEDKHVFARFRIWSAGLPDLVPNDRVGPILGSLSVGAFWEARHQRDLLLVFRTRWNSLPLDSRLDLEKRVLAGPERWDSEPEESEQDYVTRRAWSVANRLVWLSKNGCQLNLSVEDELEKLRQDAPEWKPDYAANADASLEGRGRLVRTETDPSPLLKEPLSNILAKSKEISGFTDDSFMPNDPFSGLCGSHPVKAFATLRLKAKKDQYPKWAWQTFLNSEARKNDKVRFKAFIGVTLSRVPPAMLASIVYPASEWLLHASADLQKDCLDPYEKVVQALVEALKQNPDAGKSSIVRGNRKPEWGTEALNAPTGKIAQAFYNDPRTKDLKKEQGFPREWLRLVDGLLGLDGDLRRFAVVIFTHNLNWFYYVDPDWTESNLLSALRSKDRDDTEAWWSGFLWGARRLPDDKLFEVLKPYLLEKAVTNGRKNEDQINRLGDLVLTGWEKYLGKPEKILISNNEFRRVLLNGGDRFRSRILWLTERWSNGQGGDGERWTAMLSELLSDVWPVQTAAKTASSSDGLVGLAFSNADRFLQVSEAILPHLVKIDRNHVSWPAFYELNDTNSTIGKIVDRFPERTLSVLFAVLPDNAAGWPYEMNATLDRIGNAEPALKRDNRLIELKRKWNSR